MTRTTSLPVKPTQTPNQERRNIAKSPPRSSPATRIWTTTSWGSPPERHRKAPSTGATETLPLQLRPAKPPRLLPAQPRTQTERPKPSLAQSQAGRNSGGATHQEEKEQESPRRPRGPSARAGQAVCGTQQEGPQLQVNTLAPVLLPLCVYKL